MKIGIPRERKLLEGRIVLTPQAVSELVKAGHQVWVEAGAGFLSGYADNDYREVGAQIAATLEQIYSCDLVVKVKEPQSEELRLLQPQQQLFCFLHLAAYPEVLQGLLQHRVHAYAFETLVANQRLPLLAPMSAVAGRLAIQLALYYLQQPYGGAGVLLGGIEHTHRGRVVILGGGVAGRHAAQLALAMGAEVCVLDRSMPVLQQLVVDMPELNALLYTPEQLAELLPETDILIGAVLLLGASAPRLVTPELLALMPKGRIVVDIAIDQGGCVAGIKPTNWQQPIYWQDGLGFIAVTNLPGAVPRTSTQALSQAVLPYVLKLAMGDVESLASAVAVKDGHIVHPALLK